MLVGSNPEEAHPVIGMQIRAAVERGCRLIVVDPRDIGLAAHADIHLKLRPGTNVAFANGIVNYLIQHELYDEDFVRERTEGFEILAATVRDYTPELVEDICGIDRRDLVAAAKMYAAADAAAIMYSKDMRLRQLAKVLIVDIGGFTLDYLLLRYGEPDTELFDSLEKGIIPLYNEIRNRVRKQFDILLEDSDIDLVIQEGSSPLSEEIKELVKSVVYEYVVNTLGIFREIGIDFNSITTIFVGGGSMLLTDVIKEVWIRYRGEYHIIADSLANAKGYKKLYLADHAY